ncbi:hypothetical protein F4677DRAFT_427642 [Hypoxylon crocopeplum]|nr:hypothetical protein F4677DRAFT_427642 [Hypoxylon crocopeplum]
MASHYPLNGIDLDFNRYEHRPLGIRDILVNRIMDDYMAPRRINAGVYLRSFARGDASFHPIRSHDRDLGLDIQVLSRLLKTYHNWSFTYAELMHLYELPKGLTRGQLALIFPEAPIGLETAILELIEGHYLESEPSMRIWLKHFNLERRPDEQGRGWKKNMIEHLKGCHQNSEAHYHHSVYSGGHYLPTDGPSKVQFSIDPYFVGASRLSLFLPSFRPVPRQSHLGAPSPSTRSLLGGIDSVRRGRPRRSSSMPPPGSWSTAAIDGLDSCNVAHKWIIYFPRHPLSELDKLSRRRSLSRTHIRAMFTDKPKWVHKDPAKKRALKGLKHPCANCAQYTHHTKHCPSSCGYCNSMSHKASACPVKVTNRCKCRPFPQYHTAAECYVRCSRRCGCPHPPGHLKHRSAMLCSHRCCMCGIKGHTGRKCSLKKCPCGAQHLTQDCRWKVECPVKDCNFYLCHLHCRECGKKKEKGSKDKFIGRTCQECLGNGKPVLSKAE